MDSYLYLIKTNVKHYILPYILIAFMVLSISPILMGVHNLDGGRTASVLEQYVAIIGIIMIVPIFLPEQDKGIRDVVSSKFIPINHIYIIRLLISLVMMSILILLYLWMLKSNNCTFHYIQYFFGTLWECMLLGGLGLFLYGLTDQIIVGYMFPVIYYMICLFGNSKILGIFYLFSMSQGNYVYKIIHGCMGFLLIFLALITRKK